MDINEVLKDVNKVLNKVPFTRSMSAIGDYSEQSVEIDGKEQVSIPMRMGKTVSQDRFLRELDPSSHDIHLDKNVPSIIAKVVDNGVYGWTEIKEKRVALAYQRRILDKRVQYLCGKPIKHTLCNHNPSDEDKDNFIELKEEFINKNFNVRVSELVENQMSCGDAALIMYFDNKKIKSRNVSYKDGYVIIPHYNKYGEEDFIVIYYKRDGLEKIDIYDDSMVYGLYKTKEESWALDNYQPHGFLEIPVIYKRGKVAWEDSQSIIEVTEIIYNIYTVIMKRHGWGLLYIKGKIDERLKKTAGAVVLNDPNPESQGDAKYLTPEEPVGIQNLLKDLRKEIQLQSGVVLLDPEDIKTGSDMSGLALKMMMSTAYEKALLDARFYDDIADKVTRLFKYGVGIEKAKSAQYNRLIIRGEFDVWMPQSESSITNDIAVLLQNGGISIETATEKSSYSAPDEMQRLKAERDELWAREDQKLSAKASQVRRVPTSNT